MTTNRDESLDLGRALRRAESPVSESRGEISESRGDVTGEGYGNDRVDVDRDEVGYEMEAVETPASLNNLREVRIQPLDSGYLVKVGCQSVAVETTEALIKNLNDYLTRPAAFERAWFKNQNRSKL